MDLEKKAAKLSQKEIVALLVTNKGLQEEDAAQTQQFFHCAIELSLRWIATL